MSMIQNVFSSKNRLKNVNGESEKEKEEKVQPGTVGAILIQFFEETGYWPYIKDLLSRAIIQYQEREGIALSSRLDGKGNPNEGVYFNGKIKGAAEIGNVIMNLKKNWKDIYKLDHLKG